MTTRPTPVSRGRFITFEGPEGSGKTSQAEAFRAHLAAAGVTVRLTREPGGTPTGERIRSILLSHAGQTGEPEAGAPVPRRDPEAGPPEIPASKADAGPDPWTDAFLFNAARAQLVARVIRPALDDGEFVVCARYADSTLAYQGYGAGLPLDDLRTLERLATGGLKPDLTVLLDLPAEVGLARKSGAEVTRFEAALDLAFHRRVRAGFLALAAAEPERFVVVDATRPFEAVFDAIAEVIAGRLADLRPVLMPASRTGEDEPAPVALRIPR